MKRFAPTDRVPSRVLVVDDNLLDRFIVREALEQAGLDVTEARDGVAALEAFALCPPDIVVLDVKMPKLDGFECCRRIREREGGVHVPVLMLTGLDDVESINQAYEAGATDFSAKPLNAAVLTHRVRYLLRASRTAEELRRSRSQLAHAQHKAGLGYWEWLGPDQDPRWSPEIEVILGAPPTFADSGTVFESQVHPDDRQKFDAAIHEARKNGHAVSLEHRIVCPDGTIQIVQHEVEPLGAPGASMEALVGVVQNITERRESEERIRVLAYYDSVTGLPNRTLLTEHLSIAIAQAKRQERVLAVLFLDLDHFKRINDTHGHSVGDQLLLAVANRLKRCVRDCDLVFFNGESGDSASLRGEQKFTVARLGGDEFVIVLPDVREIEDAARVARRVRDELSRPFRVVSQDFHVSTSIGISGYPMDGTDVETLLKHADAAMYDAKATGRDGFQFFTTELNERIARRLELDTALREAIPGGQLLLHYQPILSLATGRMIGLEALVRWDRPGHGRISPCEFIPVAEESQLIVELGEWVLRRACGDVAAMATHDGFDDFCLSVNLSALQFAIPVLSATVADVLAQTALPARRLELELTETVLMDNAERSAVMLWELKRLGVQIAIDDFGTGYSSLAYLKRFPIDTLKIDQVFIRDIATNANDASIVSATIGLGHSLRLNVVAEGVEDRDQLDFLLAKNCDRCQGFLLARPMPLSALREWLRREQAGGPTMIADRKLRIAS